MNLHRVGKRPDWHVVAPEQRNPWQRLAAHTSGTITPANLLSLIGIALVAWGAFSIYWHIYIPGIGLIILGRFADLFDGLIADKTDTKSPLGEALDAIFDKLSILITLAVFIAEGIVPIFVLIVIIALNGMTALCGVIAKIRKEEFHPSQFGKLSMATVWISLIAYGISHVVLPEHITLYAVWLAHGAFIIGIILGLLALIEYIQVALHPHDTPADIARETTLQFKRFIIVQNPASTNARTANKRIAELHRLFPHAVFHTIITSPEGREANRVLIEEYGDRLGNDTLICIAAGDGTANLVIETLLTSGSLPPEARRTPILPLWGGNANDLAFMLNGYFLPSHLKHLFAKAQFVPIYPLECIMRIRHKGRVVRLAACYASFGASAYAAQRLNDPMHRKSWLNALPGGRYIQEHLTVLSAFAEALPFSITENGTVRPVYERIFANGSRIARLDSMPISLGEGAFYRVTFENKHAVLAARAFSVLRRRWQRHKSFRKPAKFVTHAAIWAQFDGEALRLPEGTKVTIRLSREPFFALSTKLAHT